MDIFSIGLPLLRVNKDNKSPAEQHGVHSARKGRTAEEFKNYNVGVACGDGLVVVDVDPRNSGFETLAALEGLYGKLPSTWTVDTANRGRHYYFKGSMKSTSLNGVDIQSTGKYVIAPPSSYEYGSYIWVMDCAPWECEIAELPEWVKNINANKRIGVEIGEGEVWNGNWKKVESLLAYLPPTLKYQDWVTVGMALHWTSEERAYDVFVKWSRGDYSITKTKYENFSEDACAQKWNSFKEDGGITIGTLFRWALDCKAEYDYEHNIEEPEPEIVTETEEDAFHNKISLPEITSPLLKQLIEEISKSAYVPVPEFAYGAAFAVMSAVTQRGYVLDYHHGKTSTYSIILGPPACGKEGYLNAVLELVSETNQSIISDEVRSDQAMKQVLAEFPSRITVLDEFPDRLNAAFKPKAADNEYKVAMIYKELWSTKRILPGSRVKQAENGKNKKNDNIKQVEWPMLSIFGAGTYDKFTECLNNPEFLDGGLLSRLDLWVIKERVSGENSGTFDLSEKLKQRLRAVFEVGCGTSVISTKNDGKRVPDAGVKMHLAPCGRKAFDEFRAQCLKSISGTDPKLRSLYDRASEKALRYGMMNAVARASFDVEEQDVLLGAEIAKHLVVNAKNLLNMVGETEHSKMYRKVCEDLIKLCDRKGTSVFKKKDLHIASRTFGRKFKPHERAAFLSELKSMELISIEGGRGAVLSLEGLAKFAKTL